jgi:hypothetical protein
MRTISFLVPLLYCLSVTILVPGETTSCNTYNRAEQNIIAVDVCDQSNGSTMTNLDMPWIYECSWSIFKVGTSVLQSPSSEKACLTLPVFPLDRPPIV